MSKQFLPVLELHTLPWDEGHVVWVRSGGSPLSSKEENKHELFHAVFNGMRSGGEDDNEVTGLGELYTRWFKYDRNYLCVSKSQFVSVIFEPPCISTSVLETLLSGCKCV